MVSPVFATSLGSTNFKVIDYNLGQAGEEKSTSTNYQLQSNVELVLDAIKKAPPAEEGGGGPPPPPPPPPPDTTPPVISNVQAISIATSTATIIYNTNELADSFTEYGLTAAYGIGSKSSSTLKTSHNLALSNLTPDTLYHFRVKSKDASGNLVTSVDFSFTTLKLADTAPPVISNIRVTDITGISARVLWDTNEPSTSFVKFGLETAYGGTSGNAALATSHSVDLNGLSPDTLYHFQVISADAAGNTAESTDQTFRTLDTIPPAISNVQILNVTERNADITWVTNEATTSQIFYRRVGAAAYDIATDNTLKVSHFMPQSNLIANVDYEFYIIARDAAGNTAQSSNYTFKTLPDNISPSNIRNFTATPDDTINVLTWGLPVDPDYAGVMIVRSASTYPRNRFEGDIIYSGPGVSFTDRGLTNGTTYFYTGFAYDTSFNFASGAITQGTPVGPQPPVLPPPPPPPPPPIVPPTINLDAVSFWVANRTIQIYPDAKNVLETLAGINLGISLDVGKLPSGVELITLRIENSNYLLKLRADGSVYDTDITLPSPPAVYAGEITLVFAKDQQILKFGLDLKPKGMVFETKNGVVQPVEDAVITLYELQNGNWRIWSGGAYYQINPPITRSDGLYSFLIPNGTYYSKITKVGYRDAETNRFEVVKNYINQSLEIFAKPKSFSEIIKPEAPLVENIMAVTKNIAEKTSYTAKITQEEVVKFAQNPVVEQATANVAAPSLATMAALNAATALPMLNLWTYLQYLLTQPFLFWKRRKRKAWGVVYNAFTKLPLDLSIVRLLDAKTRRIIRTLVTDKQGRYILFAPQGEFILSVTKPGFQFPSAYLKGRKEDEAHVDLYFGEKFEVKQEGQAVVYNIPMDPVEKKVSLRRLVLTRALRGLQYGVALSGIVLTAVSLIIAPSIKLGAFLALHIALFLLFIRLAKPAKFKKWGVARDTVSGKPIANAIVRLFEPEYNKLLGTQITDAKGRYAFLVGRNIYYVTFEKAGFKTLRTKNIDMRTKAREAVITEKVKMEKG